VTQRWATSPDQSIAHSLGSTPTKRSRPPTASGVRGHSSNPYSFSEEDQALGDLAQLIGDTNSNKGSSSMVEGHIVTQTKSIAAGLAAHLHVILQLARDLGGQHWLVYGWEFREWAAAKGQSLQQTQPSHLWSLLAPSHSLLIIQLFRGGICQFYPSLF